jgi:gliding motility-associated-like protein
MQSFLPKFFWRFMLIAVLFASANTSVFATHFMGFDLTYSCIGPNQYRVQLKTYRDCNGIDAPASQTISYSSASCGVSGSVSLSSVSVTDITPLCPSETSVCAGGGGQYGVELHIYEGVVTLAPGCNDWVLSTSSCCRNNAITNLSSPGSNSIYVQTTIDNTVSPCNSSPQFASDPTLFTCVNQPVNYQQLAFDPDGDSLVYSLVNCQTAAGSSVTYAGGFSGTNPLTVPITIDAQTGQISFVPNTPQTAVMCVLVEEFRNGVKIGEIIRDMQFVIQNCSNQLPTLTGLNGSTTVFDTLTCIGSTLCFDITADDANTGDNLTMTFSGNIPGSSFIQTGSGSNIVGTFCWSPTAADIGTHVFAIIIEDDACPIVGQNTQSYTVVVQGNPNPPVDAGPDVAICAGETTPLSATSTASPAIIDYFEWSPSSGLSTTLGQNTVAGPAITTTYTATLHYTDGCASTDDVIVTVNEAASADVSPATADVCAGAGFVLTGVTDQTGMTIEWFDPTMTSLGSGTISGNTSTISVSVPGTPGTYTYTYQVTHPLTGCVNTATADLVVGSPPPLASCVNIYASPTGTAGAAGTQADPTSLAEALNRAACNDAVLKLAIGTYNIDNPLFLGSFLTIEGGFDPGNAWEKTSTPGATTINRTTANPEGPVNGQRLVAFYGNSAIGFRLQDVTITTADANQPGMSTYGLHLTACSDYEIVRTQILPGDGAQGLAGNPGTDGANGVNGANGQAGDNDTQDRNGGGGNGGTGGGGTAAGNGGACCTTGANNGTAGGAPAGINGGGGGGGASGGGEDRDGGNGGNGGGALGAGGTGGNETGCNSNVNCGSTESGNDGQNGANGTNGTIGAAGPAGGHAGNFWNPGAQAGTGTNGTGGAGGGGGGGGAGEGGFFCVDGKGSGGGGGGGGGQAGTAGTGGLGGGSSYGIYLVLNGANANVNQSNVNAGAAGLGGFGGPGGIGGNGGNGGNGSTYTGGEVGCGGDGGDGGDGGNGGNGGDGAPGEAIDVFLASGSALASSDIAFNLAAQPVITAQNINCTNTLTDFSAAASQTWNFGANATPQSPTGATVNTQFSVIDRYNIVYGANTYEGFHNVSFDGAINPEIVTNANALSLDTFQLCQGDLAYFESSTFGDTYNWDFNGAIANPGNIQTTPITAFNTPGFYTITLSIITDCCGLSPEDTIYLYVDPLPNATPSANPTICQGETAILSLAGLNPTDSVVWTPLTDIITTTANSIEVIPNATANYTATIYTVTNTNGANRISCPQIIDFTVTVNTTPSISFVETEPTCNNNGQVQATASGGAAFDFQWNTGFSTLNNTTSTLTSLGVGAYYVTATETTTGCSVVDSSFLYAAPTAPVVFLQTSTPATCGATDGSATVATTGGTPPLTYAWSNGGTGTSQTNLAGGNYCVTVTDNNGCTSSVCFDVITPPSLFVNLIGVVEPPCPNSGIIEVEGSGGTGQLSYLWSSGQTTAVITGLNAGSYSVTVTDANGCFGDTTINLLAGTGAPTLAPAIVSPILCAGDSATIETGIAQGFPPFTYSWTGGSSALFATDLDTITNAAAGMYYVTVTDSIGCVTTDSLLVTEPPVLTATADSTDVLCFGGSDGTVTATPSGGTPGYTYLWDDPATQTTATATGLAINTYNVTVTDANACTTTASTVVNQPLAALTVTMASTDASCNGGSDGSATATAADGTAGYTYLWDDPAAQTTATATGLAAGTYNVTVTDANGCSITDQATINEPTAVSATVAATDVLCFGQATGDLTAAPSGGTPGYTYLWDDPAAQTTATATGLAAGTYNVTVTDLNTCTFTTSGVVAQPATAVTVSMSATDNSCNGGSDGSATATAADGTPGYTYQWDDPTAQTTATATGLAANTYNVTVTDNNGCTITAPVTVSEPSAVTATLAVTDVLCFADASGSIATTASGGTAGYTYLWDDPAAQTTATATGLLAGSYNVTVTDANGCTFTANETVQEPASAVAVVMSSTDASCNAGSDATATATASGGTAGYTYLWDDPAAQTTATATGLSAGSYNVTVTDANGCSITDQATVNEPTALTLTLTASDVLCFGSATGQISTTTGGGTPGYTYQWDDPAAQTTDIATGLASGTYNVTITDANACTITDQATVNEPATAFVANFTSNDVSCNGGNDGDASATVSGGTPAYTYQWDDPAAQTTATATGLSAGTYNLTVTDANGCTLTNTATITEPSALTVTMAGSDVSCNGGNDGDATATVSGGTPGYTYTWDDPATQTTATATGLLAGTYNVTVTDANGCTLTDQQIISEPTVLSNTISGTDALCFNDPSGTATVVASGGIAPYTYQWDDPAAQTTATATTLLAGTYNVTITDANGCTITDQQMINEPTAVSATIAVTDVLCFGDATGELAATASGGTPGYTYAWDDPAAQTTATATGLTAGTYNIVVTDANACTFTISGTVAQPAAALAASTTTTDASCNTGSDGTATATVSGGTAGYTYQWDDPAAQTTATATGLTAGVYNVVVTDANGCTVSAQAFVGEPTAISISFTTTDILCFGQTTGAANSTVSGGTPPYNYNWSNSATTADISGVAAGTYTLTVTDANGCLATANATINQPATAVTASILSVTQLDCFGDSDGAIDADVQGGTPNYTFSWSNGANTQDISGLSAGSYSMTATDANGCTAFVSATITEPAQIIANASITSNFNGASISCPGAADGSANVSFSGGTAPYTVSWSNGANTANISNLAAGTYTATVTDANGCTATDQITVADPVPLQATETHVDVFCNGDCDGQIIVNAVSGTGTLGINGYEYNITGPGQTGNVFSATNSFFGLCAGTYTVTVRDGNNCTLPVSITIAEPAALAATTATTDVSCNGGIDGTATVTATGGVAPYTYNWSNGQTTQTAVNLAAGGYDVTITDDNGCDLVTSVVLTEPTAMAGTTSFDEPSCNGGTDGSATVSVTGGTAPYTYLWNTGSTNATAIGLGAGSYTVTSTDANGCQLINTVTVSQPQAIAVTISGSGLTCSGNGSGSATANPTGGTAPYTYLWSDGQTTATATGLNASTYTVLVVDANGCSINAQTTLSQPTPVVATQVSSTDISCNGGADGSATVMGSGGSAPYTYNWDNGQTGATATGLAAGTYTATITDANGCDATISVNIFEPAVLEIPQITTTNVSCKGGSDGSASAFVNGGTFPYSFSWSNGETTQVINNLAAGTYFVTVTDGNGCTANSSVIITEPAAFLVGVINVNDALCDGTASGQLAAVISGGTLPASGDYTYVWSNGASTPVVSAVTAGTYSLTVIDANGCTLDLSATVGNGGSINANIVASADASCFGGNDGSATVTATGGTGGLTYQWSDPAGQTNPTATNLAAGIYYVTVNDANGCAVVDSVTVGEADAFTINTNVTDVACFGENSGQLSITGASVTPGQILWSNGQVGNAASNLSAGAYSVTVTSIDGCTQTFNYNITQPTALELSIDQTSPILCNDDSTGALAATVNGGTANYSYSWTDGVNGPNRSNLPAGTYTLQVTDANGCTVAEVSQLGNPTAIGFSFVDAMGVACVGDNNGFIQVQGTGGSTALGNYEYSLDGQNWQSGNLFPNLTDGQYDIYVRDQNGCLAEDSVEVAAADSFFITSFTNSIDSTGIIIYGDTVDLEITLNEPTGAVVSWTEVNSGTILDSALAIQVYPADASIYQFTAVSPAGCVVDTSLRIQVDKPRVASAPTAFTPNSDGTNDAFFIQADDTKVTAVRTFRVFDRWGELVFESLDTQPNDPQAGWDGTFKGKTLQSAVFAWYAEVEFIDGHVEVLRGEVTLLR